VPFGGTQFFAMVSFAGSDVVPFGNVCTQPDWITSHTVYVPGPIGSNA